MSRVSRKRPWLAALLGLTITGLGHLYLRRWRRAGAWLVLLFGVAVLFVPPEAMDAYLNSGDIRAVAPVLLVGIASALDAYFLARSHNSTVREVVERGTFCPNCGREVDDDLDFCQWCTTQLRDRDAEADDPETAR
jgi:hypothetical protein